MLKVIIVIGAVLLAGGAAQAQDMECCGENCACCNQPVEPDPVPAPAPMPHH